ncbi:hypothetical protein [Actinomadura litoris]|uniref:hypothetical protein n=1 Tax=Actinomadura litoris TaxID=2678616 RepID=UPI001FA6EFB1|nr:hypothetical protein [Actinomadura litoris]
MRLWLKVHRAGPSLAGLALSFLVITLSGARSVPLPSVVRGAMLGTPIALIVPLLAAALLIRGLINGLGELELTSARPNRAYAAAFAITACLVAALLGTALTLSGTQDLGIAAARNYAAFLGLSLISGHFLGSNIATLLPSAYLFGTVLAGRSDGTPPWLWPLADSNNPWALAISLTSLTTGTTLLLTPNNKTLE